MGCPKGDNHVLIPRRTTILKVPEIPRPPELPLLRGDEESLSRVSELEAFYRWIYG
jgi:hypothetical protein